MKAFARDNGSDHGEKNKDYSANREEKLYLRGSLAESGDEHKLSPHPGGFYEKLGLYS